MMLEVSFILSVLKVSPMMMEVSFILLTYC